MPEYCETAINIIWFTPQEVEQARIQRLYAEIAARQDRMAQELELESRAAIRDYKHRVRLRLKRIAARKNSLQ